MRWEKHDQHNEYIYTLSAASGEEADVQAAIAESVAQMCRIAVPAWVRRALRPPQVQACLATLAARGVAPAFTAEHHATEFEPL